MGSGSMYDNIKKSIERVNNPLIKQTIEYMVSRIEEAENDELADIAKSALVIYIGSAAPELLNPSIDIQQALNKSYSEQLTKHNTKLGRPGDPDAPGDKKFPKNAPPPHLEIGGAPMVGPGDPPLPSQKEHGGGPGKREITGYLRDLQNIMPDFKPGQRKDLTEMSRTELKSVLDEVMPGFFESGVVRGVGRTRNTTENERYLNMLDYFNNGGKVSQSHESTGFKTNDLKQFLTENSNPSADNRVPAGTPQTGYDHNEDGEPDIVLKPKAKTKTKKPAKASQVASEQPNAVQPKPKSKKPQTDSGRRQAAAEVLSSLRSKDKKRKQIASEAGAARDNMLAAHEQKVAENRKKRQEKKEAEKQAKAAAKKALKLMQSIDACFNKSLTKANDTSCSPDAIRRDVAELKNARDQLSTALEITGPNPEIQKVIDQIDRQIKSLPESLGGSPSTPAASAPPEAPAAIEAPKNEGVTPRQLPEEDYPLTDEQYNIAKAVTDGYKDIVAKAFAGTGKTSTLLAIARRNPDKPILYLVYNTSMANEAAEKFPPNVAVRTIHSVAYEAMTGPQKSRFTKKYTLNNSDKIGYHLNVSPLTIDSGNEPIVLDGGDQVVLAKMALDNFYRGTDKNLALKHVPRGIKDGPSLNDDVRSKLLNVAKAMYADLENPNGKIKVSHDHYLKRWVDTNPDLSKWSGKRSKNDKTMISSPSIIFFDEAQDGNDIKAKLVAMQDYAQKVVVGDSNQAIYGFTGASDQIEKWNSDFEGQLTQTFRFGESIADAGNRFLELLGVKGRIKGLQGKKSTIGPIENPDTILVRTNAGAFQEAVDELKKGRRVALVGGPQTLEQLAREAEMLQNGMRVERADSPFFGFKNWDSVVWAAKKDKLSDNSVKPLVNLIQEKGADEVRRVAKQIVDPAQAVRGRDYDVAISTAHKSKGLEWNKVKIGSDFPGPKVNPDTGETELPNANELKLNYVAITRGMDAVDPGSLSWVFSLTGGGDTSIADALERERKQRAKRIGAGETIVANKADTMTKFIDRFILRKRSGQDTSFTTENSSGLSYDPENVYYGDPDFESMPEEYDTDSALAGILQPDNELQKFYNRLRKYRK